MPRSSGMCGSRRRTGPSEPACLRAPAAAPDPRLPRSSGICGSRGRTGPSEPACLAPGHVSAIRHATEHTRSNASWLSAARPTSLRDGCTTDSSDVRPGIGRAGDFGVVPGGVPPCRMSGPALVGPAISVSFSAVPHLDSSCTSGGDFSLANSDGMQLQWNAALDGRARHRGVRCAGERRPTEGTVRGESARPRVRCAEEGARRRPPRRMTACSTDHLAHRDTDSERSARGPRPPAFAGAGGCSRRSSPGPDSPVRRRRRRDRPPPPWSSPRSPT